MISGINSNAQSLDIDVSKEANVPILAYVVNYIASRVHPIILPSRCEHSIDSLTVLDPA